VTFLDMKPEQWVPLLAVLITVAIWLCSSLARTYAYQREQSVREWVRLEQLTAILNNHGDVHGGWSQVAAVEELTTLRIPRSAIERVANHALEQWAGQVAPDLRYHLSVRLRVLLDDCPDNLRSTYMR
jgi:hypothetical protein